MQNLRYIKYVVEWHKLALQVMELILQLWNQLNFVNQHLATSQKPLLQCLYINIVLRIGILGYWHMDHPKLEGPLPKQRLSFGKPCKLGKHHRLLHCQLLSALTSCFWFSSAFLYSSPSSSCSFTATTDTLSSSSSSPLYRTPPQPNPHPPPSFHLYFFVVCPRVPCCPGPFAHAHNVQRLVCIAINLFGLCMV